MRVSINRRSGSDAEVREPEIEGSSARRDPGIGELLHRKPRSSPRQRHLVATGRAIVRDPRVLFYEPLSTRASGAAMRSSQECTIGAVTSISVTHYHVEAMTPRARVCDEAGVVRRSRATRTLQYPGQPLRAGFSARVENFASSTLSCSNVKRGEAPGSRSAFPASRRPLQADGRKATMGRAAR